MEKISPKQGTAAKEKKTINEIVDKLWFVTSGIDRALADNTSTDKNLKDFEAKLDDRLKRLQSQLEAKVGDE